MSLFKSEPEVQIESVPDGEAERIAHMAELTRGQLDVQYRGQRCLRAVHPKDHGCVEASFVVGERLKDEHRVGIFKQRGRSYRAAIRFSNATGALGPDGPIGPRGMAIKLYDVEGDRLEEDGERSQDFLMITQPVFVFANAEDYEALMLMGRDKFFSRPGLSADAQRRTMRSGAIAKHSAGALPPSVPPPFPLQAPPLSPLDGTYFSAAPFLFGKGRAMKFRALPVNPVAGALGAAAADPDYLRKAMRKRMADSKGKAIGFDFQVQVRDSKSLRIGEDIEDSCTLWDEKAHPFVTVARIDIPPQDVDSRAEFCETLFFTPWHGLKAHRPLGGINRVRREVYAASSKHRGCPVSPPLPTEPRRR